MRIATLQIGLMVLAASAASTVAAVAQEPQDASQDTAMEARIWLDRGEDPVLQRGDRVRIYYWVNTDSYVALFHIDTDGSVTLLYPRSPGEDDFARAGRDYRLLFPSSSFWFVDEYPGKGYFFIVASSQPLDFNDYGYSSYDHAWDLTQVGQSVYTDPYVAMDDHVAHLIPDWQNVPYALDFASYDVGQAYEYPRFMCYQCHGYRSYTAWDPYAYGCSAVRVVIWNDPYFSPAYRYQGTRVVLAQPRYGVPRYQFKRRAPGESWVPLIRTRQPPTPGVHYLEPGRAAVPRSAQPGRYAVPREEPARAGPRTAPPPETPQRRVFVPRSKSAAPDAPADRPTPPTTVAPPNPGKERPTLLRRPTSILVPESSGQPRGDMGSGARPSQGREVVPPPRPTVTTRPSPAGPTVTPRPAPSRAPSRPVVTPRPKTGGGGRPIARPSRTGGGGGRPVARPVRRGGGGGGRSFRMPVRRRGGGGV